MSHRDELAHLGAALRATRDARGLSLEQVAGLSGINHGLISRYEHGRVEPGVLRFLQLCRVYRVSLQKMAREIGV